MHLQVRGWQLGVVQDDFGFAARRWISSMNVNDTPGVPTEARALQRLQLRYRVSISAERKSTRDEGPTYGRGGAASGYRYHGSAYRSGLELLARRQG